MFTLVGVVILNNKYVTETTGSATPVTKTCLRVRCRSTVAKWPTTETETLFTRNLIRARRTMTRRTRGSSSSVTRASRRMTSARRSKSSAASRTSGSSKTKTRAKIKVAKRRLTINNPRFFPVPPFSFRPSFGPLNLHKNQGQPLTSPAFPFNLTFFRSKI